jgi:acyl-CoA thioesterase 8
MTDFQFIGTASRSVGLTRTSTPRLGMLASLDHTTHFYPFPLDFDAREPLLHLMECPLADVGAGRGVARGLLFTKSGKLIAVTEQEGVLRADYGRPPRGLIEGDGMGDDKTERSDKNIQAKL